jgi:hypothetical protein
MVTGSMIRSVVMVSSNSSTTINIQVSGKMTNMKEKANSLGPVE